MVFTLVSNLPMSAFRLQQFQEMTKADTGLAQLLAYASSGWPQRKSSIPVEARKFWHMRNITEEAGVLFLHDHIVVPTELREEMLAPMHESHLGESKCKTRARPMMYWPGMSADIEATVRQCTVCSRFQNSNAPRATDTPYAA